ncbi:MAG: LysR family transcriptional regulator [Clostridia bacterium]|nr:LysR family transcriptional regulator [Clostridia bacterium]
MGIADIKLDQYRIFYRVAACGSFTGAAEELFLTQSAVSQAVKNLEEALGTQLFVRGKRGVSLTQDGEVMFRYVSNAMVLLEQAGSQLSKMQSLETGELRIGVGDTIAKHLLLPVLERFSRAYPGIELRILNRVSRETIDLLRSGHIDLAIVNMPLDDSGVYKVGEMPVNDCFVAGTEYAKKLTGRKLSFEELAIHQLILLETKTNSRRLLDNFFSERRIFLRPGIELGNHDLMIDFAEANLGIACVVEQFAAEAIRQGRVVKLDTEPLPPRSIGVFTLRSHVTPAARVLLDMADIDIMR